MQLLISVLLSVWLSSVHAANETTSLPTTDLSVEDQTACHELDGSHLVVYGTCEKPQHIQSNRSNFKIRILNNGTENEWMKIKISDCSFKFNMHEGNIYSISAGNFTFKSPINLYVVKSNVTITDAKDQMVTDCQFKKLLADKPIVGVVFSKQIDDVLENYTKTENTNASTSDMEVTKCGMTTINYRTVVVQCKKQEKPNQFVEFIKEIPLVLWMVAAIFVLLCCSASSATCLFLSTVDRAVDHEEVVVLV
ncbi:hypothetical protein M3Y98_01223400 [Aphelenchoides besseyi]|nr:hypothetical protein M3Y98_01223400 [Aphelenchoides besseyi]